MTPLEMFLIAVIALFVAILGNIGGFGGGVIVVPLLIFLPPLFEGSVYDSEVVAGTVLLAVIFPTLLGTILAWRKKQVDFKFGLLMGIPSALGAVGGAFVSSFLDDIYVVIVVTVLASLLSVRMIIFALKGRSKRRTSSIEEDDVASIDNDDKGRIQLLFEKIGKMKPTIKIDYIGISIEVSVFLVLLLGILFGLMAGLFGISGGWLQTPLLILLFVFPPLIASGTSLFIVALKAIVGGVTHIALGNIHWVLFGILAISMPLGAAIGHYIKERMKKRTVSFVIGVALLLIAAFTITFYLI